MAKAKNKKQPKRVGTETDGLFFLKIVLYLIVGAQWVYLTDPGITRQIPIPIGLLVGCIFALHDHFQIDRKIEFAILLVSCFIGYWAQIGLLVSVLN